jgi:very-short-patch-repair endonuclease
MDAQLVLRAHGGSMRAGQLRRYVSKRRLQRAVAAGTVVYEPRGVYSFPGAERRRVLATTLRGVQSHETAAVHWGLALVREPTGVHISIPQKAQRNRVPHEVRLHYRDLSKDEMRDQATSPLRTVVDCLRDLSLEEALAVGDSALRIGMISADALRGAASRLRGPGSARVRTRVECLDGRAANAFESACRAILIEAGIAGFEPQLEIRSEGRLLARVDLGHRSLRIVIECESFAHHGDRQALRRDCRRYTALASLGWSVLRFSWEDVMFDPTWVATAVRLTIARVDRPAIAVQQPTAGVTKQDDRAA